MPSYRGPVPPPERAVPAATKARARRFPVWAIVAICLVGVAAGALATWFLFASEGHDRAGSAVVPDHAGMAINLVSARDLGCSDDVLTGADLHVTVQLDGHLFLDSRGVDDNKPLFAVVAPASPLADSRVRVHVEDDEPAFLSSPTECDVDPGAANDAEFPWDGQELHKVLRGAGPQAAEVVLTLGRAPGPVSGIKADAGTDNVRFSWTPPSPAPDNIQVARGTFGEVAATISGKSTGTSLTGLCDGIPYTVRIIAQTGDWWVGTPFTFTTANVPPAPPRILSASVTGTDVSVTWEEPTPHDAKTYELHAGPLGFSPRPASQRGTHEASGDAWHQATTIPLRAGDAAVVVRATDLGGLATDSSSLAIGAPGATPTPFAEQREACQGSALSGGRDFDVPLPPWLPFAALLVAVVARSGSKPRPPEYSSAAPTRWAPPPPRLK